MVAIPFPQVPITLGVPPVPRDASNSNLGPEQRLTKDADQIDQLASSQWGIYYQGRNVLQPDNIVSIGYATEYRMSDYPLEGGGFETFNKVATPFSNRVVMTKGGRLSDRQAFLSTLDSIRGDLRLYDVITPERVYLNVNVERVVIDRSAESGAGMLTVEVVLREIRQSATIAFSNSQAPSGADAVSGGSVQTQASAIPPSEIN